MTIWYNLLLFAYIPAIWYTEFNSLLYIFPILVHCLMKKSGNPVPDTDIKKARPMEIPEMHRKLFFLGICVSP
jgi:hypothetical protein